MLTISSCPPDVDIESTLDGCANVLFSEASEFVRVRALRRGWPECSRQNVRVDRFDPLDPR